MNRRVVLRLFPKFLGSMLLSACAGPTYTFRYRLTLFVDVDGEVKVGSSVIEVKYVDHSTLAGLTQGVTWGVRLRGEATMVDLGSFGVIFCLLKEDPERPTSVKAGAAPLIYFPSYGLGLETGKEGGQHLTDLMSHMPKAGIDLERLPLLVRFRDINNPTTVERVDPTDFAASFGPKVKLLRAMIEITNDPVTTGIDSKLKWLEAALKTDGMLDGHRYHDSTKLSNALIPSDLRSDH